MKSSRTAVAATDNKEYIWKLKTLTKQNLLNGRSLDSLLSSEIEFMETIFFYFSWKTFDLKIIKQCYIQMIRISDQFCHYS